jgi:hypothetical protein
VERIEELRLATNPARVYVQSLRDVIGAPLSAPKVTAYRPETFNQVDYDPSHLLPFLVDMFVSMPKTLDVGWYGARAETLRLFAQMWEKLGFTGRILVPQPSRLLRSSSSTIRDAAATEILTQADVFVFDFGGVAVLHLLDASLSESKLQASPKPTDEINNELRENFLCLVGEERRRLATGEEPRRIIALNAIHNDHEALVCSFVATPATPFSTHMRHGFVFPDPTPPPPPAPPAPSLPLIQKPRKTLWRRVRDEAKRARRKLKKKLSNAVTGDNPVK